MRLATCNICPRQCTIKEGGIGFVMQEAMGWCGNQHQLWLCHITALDPIEKTLYQFHPGAKILS